MLAEWMREALKASGVSGSEMARQLTARLGRSFDPAAVSKMHKGQRKISADEMLAIADITGHPPPTDGEKTSTRVPLVDWVSAGVFTAREGRMRSDEFQHIEASGLRDGEWMALRVEGDSMDRISPPESIIFVDMADKKLIPNACYIVATEDGAATYKRYRPSPDRFEPVTFNQAHEPIFPNGGVRIIGRVRRTTLDM